MEDRVYIAFNDQIELIKKDLREKLGSKINDDDLNVFTDSARVLLEEMVQLMREGKSAHEKFFSDIILNSVDAIIGLDNNFSIFLWNKGAEVMFGYKKEEITGKDFLTLIPDYKIKDGEKEFLISEVREKGYLANYETDRITKSGEIIHVSVTRFEVYNDNREVIGSVGIVRDVTQVRKLEKELRERENLALIGEVVSSIAHSLSNPLNIISGNADYLLLDKKPGDEGYDELKTIIDEASRITKSIRYLLNLSRPIRINKQLNNINSLLSDIISNCKYLVGSKKISFKKNFQKDLQDFYFDKEQIHEVFSNLITNAIQSISKEGEIKVKTYIQNAFFYAEVCDTGQGISKENIENIFKPFYSSKEYGKGTGLGLSITKRNVRNHSGDISIRSSHGKGSIFTVKLPLK